MDQSPVTSHQSIGNKISDFWQKNTWFRRTIKVVILPWGIASIIKWCVSNTPSTSILKREPEVDEKNTEPNQLQQHEEANFTVDQIEEKYQQYSQNPNDPNTKQTMINIFKHCNPCMVFQFLVKQMPTTEDTLNKLPQEITNLIEQENLELYNDFVNKYRHLSIGFLSCYDFVINIQGILTSTDNLNAQQSGSQQFKPEVSSATLIACNVFTDDQLDELTKKAPQYTNIANDTIALRSFIKGLSTEQLQAIAEDNYSPTAFSKLLYNPQDKTPVPTDKTPVPTDKTPVPEQCIQFFINGRGQTALEILVEQALIN